MSDLTRPDPNATPARAVDAETRADRRMGWLIFAGCFAIVVAIFVLVPGAWRVALPETLKFDLTPLLAQSALVQFHVVTVAVALLLGPVQFVLPKGTGAHRVFGWIWAAAMLSTGVATFFIRDMRDGQFSPIHIFSVMALVGVPMALWLARKKVMSHARAMTGLYIGLVIAGVSAIAPGRVIWEMFFG
ncbi:MAG: hypothetical protein DCF16_09625 [Alphaproteobacteria bacterium]|nr:MAG: hypothetical protein DCF16_09625 [Alphaproteobacteria bacterium]